MQNHLAGMNTAFIATGGGRQRRLFLLSSFLFYFFILLLLRKEMTKSAQNWVVSLHYTACVLSLLHCIAGLWVYYTVPEAEDDSENHLGINIAEDNLTFFIIIITYQHTNSKLLLFNKRSYNLHISLPCLPAS